MFKYLLPVILQSIALFTLACSTLNNTAEKTAEKITKESSEEKSIERALAGEASLVTQAWVQYGARGELLARALTVGGTCPTLDVDGSILAMKLRGVPSEEFSINVCELKISDQVQKINLGELILPVPPKKIKKILILGDTGCRIKKHKKGYDIQNCNDPKAWPFAQLAKSAADWGPDLIIHVGDYHYREAPCPEKDSRCAGSKSGDNWPSWQDDFFSPVQALLRKAPWVFVRGNHESCARGGNGWSKFLDPHIYSDICLEKSDPYWVKLGDHVLAVIDSAEDTNIQTSLDAIEPPANAITWMALHRPFLTKGADHESTTTPALNTNLQSKISVVFAGHLHNLSLNQFSDGRPPELITGNGGTQLTKPPKEMDKSDVYRHFADFGFLTLERKSSDSWALVEHDVTGKEVLHCTLTEAIGLKTKINCD